MMKRSVCLLSLLLSITASMYAQGEGCPASSPRLPGSIVQLSKSTGTPDPSANYSLMLKASSTKEDIPVAWSPDSNEGNLSFTVPKNADGLYTLQDFKKTPPDTSANQAPSYVVSPAQILVAKPAITAVSPNGAFLDDKGTHSFTILLNGLCSQNNSAPTKDVKFYFAGIKTPDFNASCSSIQKQACYGLTVDNAQQVTLTLRNLDATGDYYKGKQNFILRVDGADTAPATLTLINTTSSMPLTAALVGFALILLAIYLLLRSGREGMTKTMHGKTYWLSTLFFDQQTNSYSLSKCQFYAWTATSIIAYLFLAVSKSYVQGSAVFPDIPSGLPGILLASVGTVVLSTGITSAKGDKGAGAPGPNLSDFIATGGVVAADRLQFAVWTLVGIGTFLAIVFHSDPRDISDLPAIPTGFLQLMGISAAGYLGGKLARKAGPTISAIVLTTSHVTGGKSYSTFQITGSGLSRSAIFSIDDKPIFPDTILGRGNVQGLPEIVQLDPTVGDPDFARVLAFSIGDDDFREAWLGSRNFTITNPDSQKATVNLQKFKITEITATPGAAPVFRMIGECLDSPLKVECVNTPKAAGGPVQLVVNRTAEKSSSTVFEGVVTLPDGNPAALAVSDKLRVTVTDEAGFTRTLKEAVVA